MTVLEIVDLIFVIFEQWLRGFVIFASIKRINATATARKPGSDWK